MFILGRDGSFPQKRMLFVGCTGADVLERQNLLNSLTEIDNPLGQSNLEELVKHNHGFGGVIYCHMVYVPYQSRIRLHNLAELFEQL